LSAVRFRPGTMGILVSSMSAVSSDADDCLIEGHPDARGPISANAGGTAHHNPLYVLGARCTQGGADAVWCAWSRERTADAAADPSVIGACFIEHGGSLSAHTLSFALPREESRQINVEEIAVCLQVGDDQPKAFLYAKLPAIFDQFVEDLLALLRDRLRAHGSVDVVLRVIF
jgi:hypothetical protein